MPTLTITKNYADGQDLTEAHLDTAFESVETFLNTTKLGSDNLQSSAVIEGTITNGAVTEGKLASSAVTTTKISDASITLAKFAAEVTAKLCPAGSISTRPSLRPSARLLAQATAPRPSTCPTPAATS
jgi:hypothetical protein